MLLYPLVQQRTSTKNMGQDIARRIGGAVVGGLGAFWRSIAGSEAGYLHEDLGEGVKGFICLLY